MNLITNADNAGLYAGCGGVIAAFAVLALALLHVL